jgi:hypothetical protein
LVEKRNLDVCDLGSDTPHRADLDFPVSGEELPLMPDPTVRDMLLAKVDELTAAMTTHLEEVRTVTEQLEPDRARPCRNAITMALAMVDEVRLRAHARPLDEDGGLNSGT